MRTSLILALLLVACGNPYPTTPTPHVQYAEALPRWYCTALVSARAQTDGCHRTVAGCESMRAGLLGAAPPGDYMSQCAGAAVAYCFNYEGDGGAVQSCHTTHGHCLLFRDFVLTKTAVLTDCAARR
jgi:hypothetical protein